MARALVKVRVTGLEDVPWFFTFSEGETPESDSWIVQCEIISTRLLGAQAQDEDFPPLDPDDLDPNHFEFFCYGQPGQGPPPPPDGPINPNHLPPNGNEGWAPWPPQNAGQHLGLQGVLQPIPDEAPPLIPFQPILGPQDGHDNPNDHMAMPEEEIIQNLQNQVAEQPMAEEQVLAMDDDIGSDIEQYPQVQLPIPPVEIVPFPYFNNLQPLLPEEIQEEDLMGWIHASDNVVAQPHQLEENAQPENIVPPEEIDQPQDNVQPVDNVQLGIVQLHNSWPQNADLGPCPEAIRQWVRHFSNHSSDHASVLIPDL